MELNHVVAKNMKRIREQRKLTLDAAAKLTGVSRSMLAQIEKGEVNPTLSVMWRIANKLKVSFSALIDDPGEPVSIVRGAQTTPVEADNGRYLVYPAFVIHEKNLLECYRVVIFPEGRLVASPHLPGTEEYLTVFTGEAEICVGGELYALQSGDSIRFTADVEHSYRNTGGAELQMSMMIYYNNG